MINEAQLVLAEKRTSLAALRTGLALLGLPLAIVSFLIAMSEHYQIARVWGYLLPVMVVCTALGVLGVYMCWRAVKRIHRADDHLADLKNMSPEVGHQLD
jgi:Na+/melibiose symporter-like transporter